MQFFYSKNTRITDAENHDVLVLCSDNQRHLMSLRAARKLENAESAEPWKKGLCTSDFTLMRQPYFLHIDLLINDAEVFTKALDIAVNMAL